MSVKGDTVYMIDALEEVQQLYFDICDDYRHIPELEICYDLCKALAIKLKYEILVEK